MAIVSIPNPLTDGSTAYGSEVIADINALSNDYNGNITNANLSASAGIIDSKLAQITTGAKVSGTALTGLASIPAGAGVIPQVNVPSSVGLNGQCRLVKSGANLVLQPYNGNAITISGVTYNIPAAGTAALGVGGLSANTTYYIYAYQSGGVVAIETSVTVHSVDATAGNIGVEIKTGDNTRSFVGLARTTAGTAWADSATQRFVISWFNRQNLYLQNTFSTDRSTTSLNSYVELNTEIRCEFLTWSTESVALSSTGSGISSATNHSIQSAIGVDSTTTAQAGTESFMGVAAVGNGLITSISAACFISPAEGYHYATILGCVDSAGTGTWYSTSLSSKAKVYLNAGIRG